MNCPNCDADIVIDEAVLEAGVVTCDGCEESFALDLADDEDEDDEEN